MEPVTSVPAAMAAPLNMTIAAWAAAWAASGGRS